MFEKIRQLEEAYEIERAPWQFPSRPSQTVLAAAIRWSEAVWTAAEQIGPVSLEERELREGLALAVRPVFICGVHRSGTTLVRDLLDGHSALSVLPSEGSFLTNLQGTLAARPVAERLGVFGQEWLRRLANPALRPPFWLLGRTTSEGSPYVTFARRLIAWWHVAQRAFSGQHEHWPQMALALAYTSERHVHGSGLTIDYWVDKTPTNELYLPRLWKEFPAAKCIHVVRNPLAVYASRKRIEQRARGHFSADRRALQELTQSLRIAVEHSAHADRSTYLMIRYEDLLASPRDVIDQLATFLEIESTSTLLRPTVANTPVSPNSSFRSDQQRGQIILAGPVDQCDELTPAEQTLVAAYTEPLAARLGYALMRLTPIQRFSRKFRFLLRHAYRRVPLLSKQNPEPTEE